MSCTFQEQKDVHIHHGHEHVHHEHLKLGDLKKGIFITLAYFAVEFITGYLTNSLAMLGDSIHMLTDGFVLVLTYWVYKLRSVPPRDSVVGYLSFGFRRLELLIIILNTLLVGTAIFWIVREAYLRLMFGHTEILAWPVFLVGTLGLVVNLAVFKTLSVHSHGEEGIKSAIACAVTDALGSVAVIIGSVVVLIDQRLFSVDILAAIMIAGMLIWSFRKTPKIIFNMIMEAVPIDIDFNKVTASINKVYGVSDVLDLHINKISSDLTVLSGSVLISSHTLHDSVPDLIKTHLQEEFPELKNVHLTIETRCSSDPT